MANKRHRKAIPELKKFIDIRGREYLNIIAAKLLVSERTVMRWYKQTTAPSPAEREKVLKIIQGYKSRDDIS